MTGQNNYILPHIVSLEIKVRTFQYKLLNSILYFNKTSSNSEKLACHNDIKDEIIDETPTHLLVKCLITNHLWNQIRCSSGDKFNSPPLNIQSDIFGLTYLITLLLTYLIPNH